MGSGRWVVPLIPNLAPKLNLTWAMASGKLEVGSNKWAVTSGQRALASSKLAVASGQWQVGSGRSQTIHIYSRVLVKRQVVRFVFV